MQDVFISAFGPRIRNGYDFHHGMDLRTPATGPPQSEIDIYAAHDGTVET